jgi:hypothetical protein
MLGCQPRSSSKQDIARAKILATATYVLTWSDGSGNYNLIVPNIALFLPCDGVAVRWQQGSSGDGDATALGYCATEVRACIRAAYTMQRPADATGIEPERETVHRAAIIGR